MICGLLLCATMILYMDRQTLPNLASRITKEFDLSQEQYGNLELAFGWAFAVGSLVFGVLADTLPTRWLYPFVLLMWSLAGFMTGFVTNYEQLLICRAALGFFEAGHWPCALRTVQRLLARSDRPLGNSLLQSGASIGAIATPLIIRFMIGDDLTPGIWRLPFLVIGGAGLFWIVCWFLLLRGQRLDSARPEAPEPAARLVPAASLPVGRAIALLVMVTCINATWQLMRAWLPKFLQEGRGYTEAFALYFNSAFYIATDIGCLGAGALAFYLARRGWTVPGARLTVFGLCVLLTALSPLLAVLPAGWPMLGVILLIGAGSLGMHTCYYSYVQDISVAHVGKVAGTLAAIGWFLSSPTQTLFGRIVDRTQSFDLSIGLVGLPPLIGFLAMALLWGRDRPENRAGIGR